MITLSQTVFADAFYWVALINPKDSSHRRALQFSKSLKARELTDILTNDEHFVQEGFRALFKHP